MQLRHLKQNHEGSRCCTGWMLIIKWESMAAAAHGCPAAPHHVPAAWTWGAAVLPLGRSLCRPAKQGTETRNQSDTSETQPPPPPSSRHSINRMKAAQKRRGLLAQDGFSRGCSVRKKKASSTAQGQFLAWHGALTQGSHSTISSRYLYHRICTYLCPSLKEKEPESGSPGE